VTWGGGASDLAVGKLQFQQQFDAGMRVCYEERGKKMFSMADVEYMKRYLRLNEADRKRARASENKADAELLLGEDEVQHQPARDRIKGQNRGALPPRLCWASSPQERQ
jgi:hypothetical protein